MAPIFSVVSSIDSSVRVLLSVSSQHFTYTLQPLVSNVIFLFSDAVTRDPPMFTVPFEPRSTFWRTFLRHCDAAWAFFKVYLSSTCQLRCSFTGVVSFHFKMAAKILFIFLALLTIQSLNSGKESHLFSSASALVICTTSLRGLSIKRLLSFNVSSCGSGILPAPHSKFAILAKSLRPKEVSSRSKESYFTLILYR